MITVTTFVFLLKKDAVHPLKIYITFYFFDFFFYLNVVDFQSEDSSTPNKHTPTRARRKPAYQVMLLLLYFKETHKTPTTDAYRGIDSWII